MKETFEEDLGRIHRQLTDMERSRRRLQRHLQAITDKHPDAVNNVEIPDDDTESSDVSPSSANGFYMDDRSREASVEVSPNHRPRPEVLAAMLETAGIAQGGLFSDSVQLENRLQHISALQGGDNGANLSPSQVMGTGEEPKIQGGAMSQFAFASDSVQFSQDDMARIQPQASTELAPSQSVPNDMEGNQHEVQMEAQGQVVEPIQAAELHSQARLETPRQAVEQLHIQVSPSQGQAQPTHAQTSPVQIATYEARIRELETKISRMAEQHATELAIQEFRLSTRQDAALKEQESERKKAEEEAQRVKEQEAEAARRQQQQREDADRQRAFIQELQKVMGSLRQYSFYCCTDCPSCPAHLKSIG